ncbi:Cilia- and flagella-associated protein 57 [Entophlyctis luteolus]|nr:Cilia- and flagella-associated protein 57 [Entophlyctis luteolus]
MTSRGFIAAGDFGAVDVFEREAEQYERTCRVPLPGDIDAIRTMAISGTEASLMLQTRTNASYKLNLSDLQVKQLADVKLYPVMPAYHHGAITGLDVCTRKPLLVSCAADGSVRLWNYLTGECELCRYFPEDAYCVAMHPSGLFVLVGFGDKLRLMNVLLDEFRVFKEFGIRGCREASFANGGHLFAAAHGNIIQIYNTWTTENVYILKGHNSKVRSLHWTPDDMLLVSSGSDGAVYSWNVLESKRESEYILKNCSFTSAVCSSDGKSLYAVGNDRLLKEITDSAVSVQIESADAMTQVAISHSGRMLFAGTTRGTVRAVRFPLSADSAGYHTHQAHARGAVTRLRVSATDAHLFSAGEDGCIYMYKLTDRHGASAAVVAAQDAAARVGFTTGMGPQSLVHGSGGGGMGYSDEILITKSELEDMTAAMAEMGRSLEERKLEHEYQLRLKDMTLTERLKELREKFTQEIEALKIGSSVLRNEKEKEESKQEEEISALKMRHMNELHEREAKYNQQLMHEYEKYQALQSRVANQQDQWQKAMREFDAGTHRAMTAVQKDAEDKMSVKQAEKSKIIAQLHTQRRECDEMARQNSQDIDTEITLIQNRYEKKLRSERDEGARLKGENGIMRKKFNTLTKEIEDNKSEIARLREDERKLRSVIAMLDKEIVTFKKEMSDRDELIQDKERRVYELKKKNQELEKFKFVLDFRIKELKEQVEPRETQIAVMTEQISAIDSDLAEQHALTQERQAQISALATRLAQMQERLAAAVARVRACVRVLRGLRVDVEDSVQYIQDPPVLRKCLKAMFAKYCARDAAATLVRGAEVEREVRDEYSRQTASLAEGIAGLRHAIAKSTDAYRADGIASMIQEERALKQLKVNKKKDAVTAPKKDPLPNLPTIASARV